MIEFDMDKFEEVQNEVRQLMEQKITEGYTDDTLILSLSAVLRALIKRRGGDEELISAIEAIIWTE